LRTAWISHRWAEKLSQPWVIRFEDIDRPRLRAGMAEGQLADLRTLGLSTDSIYFQTSRENRHWDLFQRAVETGQVYPCYCSRKEVSQALAKSASAPHTAPLIYDGHCRHQGTPRPVTTLGWRFKTEEPSGRGDFIIARTTSGPPVRREGFIPAYHWACAIDDFDGGYDLLVRAWDLHAAVAFQRAVHRWLAQLENRPRPYPAVFHTSLVVKADGHRLEKRTPGLTLNELIASGFSPVDLTDCFLRSLANPLDGFTPERVWGETAPTLSITDLLIRVPR
jgi:glutamyl/glutaminyl-tRNA synthetase